MHSSVRLGVDVDSVLCDSVPSLLNRINYWQGTQLTKSDVVQWDFPVGNYATLGQLILEAFRDPEFVVSLPPMTGAVFHMSLLCQAFDVVVVTSRKQLTVGATREWVEKWFGPLPVVHTGDSKNDCQLDILVDDAPHNVVAFADSGRPAILFDQPWNRKVPVRPLVWRCRDWWQVYDTVYNHALPAVHKVYQKV